MISRAKAAGPSPPERAADRAFWDALLDLRARTGTLPRRTGAGYGNRRFALIRHAAWITLFRSVEPTPIIGVFLRVQGPAGEAFYDLATRDRASIERRLRDALGPGAEPNWGAAYHPGMIDIGATIGAPFPRDDAAAGLHIAWLLQAGAVPEDPQLNLQGVLSRRGVGGDRPYGNRSKLMTTGTKVLFSPRTSRSVLKISAPHAFLSVRTRVSP
jgi:hypothetical protein